MSSDANDRATGERSEQQPLCPQCGESLQPGAPHGLCAKCLLRLGFDSIDSVDARGRTATYRPPFIAPLPEHLAPLFPQLEILRRIGHGGMGVVYEARQPQLDRSVALKILRPDIEHEKDFAARFQREARMLAKLSHPNIVNVYDFGRADSIYYIVMEYVEGTNLRAIEQSGQLTPAEALAIVPQICQALEYAHSHGIVHRDIKPENILITTDGRVKIADFGLAKLTGQFDNRHLTGLWQIMGTPHYMAPEQVERPASVDHRADIYSLGVVLYEMLTGELPLGRFPLPSTRAQLDVRLDDVVLRTLEKEPSLRYQRASEVSGDIDRLNHSDAAPFDRRSSTLARGADAVYHAVNVAKDRVRGAGSEAVAAAKRWNDNTQQESVSRVLLFVGCGDVVAGVMLLLFGFLEGDGFPFVAGLGGVVFGFVAIVAGALFFRRECPRIAISAAVAGFFPLTLFGIVRSPMSMWLAWRRGRDPTPWSEKPFARSHIARRLRFGWLRIKTLSSGAVGQGAKVMRTGGPAALAWAKRSARIRVVVRSMIGVIGWIIFCISLTSLIYYQWAWRFQPAVAYYQEQASNLANPFGLPPLTITASGERTMYSRRGMGLREVDSLRFEFDTTGIGRPWFKINVTDGTFLQEVAGETSAGIYTDETVAMWIARCRERLGLASSSPWSSLFQKPVGQTAAIDDLKNLIVAIRNEPHYIDALLPQSAMYAGDETETHPTLISLLNSPRLIPWTNASRSGASPARSTNVAYDERLTERALIVTSVMVFAISVLGLVPIFVYLIAGLWRPLSAVRTRGSAIAAAACAATLAALFAAALWIYEFHPSFSPWLSAKDEMPSPTLLGGPAHWEATTSGTILSDVQLATYLTLVALAYASVTIVLSLRIDARIVRFVAIPLLIVGTAAMGYVFAQSSSWHAWPALLPPAVGLLSVPLVWRAANGSDLDALAGR